MEYGIRLPAGLSFDADPKSIMQMGEVREVRDLSIFYPDDKSSNFSFMVVANIGAFPTLNVTVQSGRVVSYEIGAREGDKFEGLPLSRGIKRVFAGLQELSFQGELSAIGKISLPFEFVEIETISDKCLYKIKWMDGENYRPLISELFSDQDLPDGFAYPEPFLSTYRCGLINIEQWRILNGSLLRRAGHDVAQMFPGKMYVPFARLLETNTVACWENSTGLVKVIDLSLGTTVEPVGEFPSFAEWLRYAFDELVKYGRCVQFVGSIDPGESFINDVKERGLLLSDFKYPPEFLRVVELGLVDFDPTKILLGDHQRSMQADLGEKYPNRPYLALASRDDREEAACWDCRTGSIVVIDPFAPEGQEKSYEVSSFYDWLLPVVDEYIYFLVEDDRLQEVLKRKREEN